LVGPDLGDQLLLRDRTLAMDEQINEEAEHFRPQPDGLAGPGQDVALGIEDTVAKDIVHGSTPPWYDKMALV
jgi:hypothetical protein